MLNAASTLPCLPAQPPCSHHGTFSPARILSWQRTGMMKAPHHSPILRGPKRALQPLKSLSKALEMKTNMVLICNFFYSIIKTAANLNQRHKIAGGNLCCRGEPSPAGLGLSLPAHSAERGVALVEGSWSLHPGHAP